jgi:hypothetical protein
MFKPLVQVHTKHKPNTSLQRRMILKMIIINNNFCILSLSHRLQRDLTSDSQNITRSGTKLLLGQQSLLPIEVLKAATTTTGSCKGKSTRRRNRQFVEEIYGYGTDTATDFSIRWTMDTPSLPLSTENLNRCSR